MGNWIWYPGDFEVYHSMLVHCRREDFGLACPSMLRISRPETVCAFWKEVELTEPAEVIVYSYGRGRVHAGGKRYGFGVPFVLQPGRQLISVFVDNISAFPSILIPSGPFATDASWKVNNRNGSTLPAGSEPGLDSPDQDPAVFPFCYEKLTPFSAEEVSGGVLYDFGCEQFGPVTLSSSVSNGKIRLNYGESREEALDDECGIIHEVLPPFDGSKKLASRAFRYLWIRGEFGIPTLEAELEYLPIEDIGRFETGEEKLDKIWEISSRTFHLNSREFYFDGIKRDRWVWSGDSYQSFMINRYLYFDEAIVRRTIRALLGKPPYQVHINTINDYSVYLILSVWDHYFATGDLDFVASVWGEVKQLYSFIAGRVDENGYVVKREHDWIFIDWSEIDKTDPVCAEQILLWELYRVMDRLAEAMGETGDYADKAADLKEKILQNFWDDERGAFIDSFTSGKKNITRHANIFAILYDFVDEEKAKRITDGVLLGDLALPITTPYFKFFELNALAKRGEIAPVQDYIRSYWGGMVDLGATTVWEQYDPTAKGIEHYGMYGGKFAKSLCHAWGCGPIVLQLEYVAGVRPTDIAYRTFEVCPNPGKYASFRAVVPVKGGTVTVCCSESGITACSTVPGGTLKFSGTVLPMEPGKTVCVNR